MLQSSGVFFIVMVEPAACLGFKDDSKFSMVYLLNWQFILPLA